MEINNRVVDRSGEVGAEFQSAGKAFGFGNVQHRMADKLHQVAEALNETATGTDPRSGMAQCGKQASAWLNRSSDYVRQFDYKLADAQVREYVGRNPGRSILIAGGVGFIIGAILRRR